MMIPFPFLIKAKYFVLILIVVTVAFASAAAEARRTWRTWVVCSLDICYVKFAPARGVSGKFSNLGVVLRI